MQSDPAKKQFADRLIKAMQDSGYVPKPSVLEREFNQRYWGNFRFLSAKSFAKSSALL